MKRQDKLAIQLFVSALVPMATHAACSGWKAAFCKWYTQSSVFYSTVSGCLYAYGQVNETIQQANQKVQDAAKKSETAANIVNQPQQLFNSAKSYWLNAITNKTDAKPIETENPEVNPKAGIYQWLTGYFAHKSTPNNSITPTPKKSSKKTLKKRKS